MRRGDIFDILQDAIDATLKAVGHLLSRVAHLFL